MNAYCPACWNHIDDEESPRCPNCGNVELAGGGWPRDSLLGQVVDGNKYEVRRILGSGGFGRVYEVHHTLIGRRLAMKVLKPEVTGNPAYERSFMQEVAALMEIRHENLVAFHEVGRLDDGRLFLLMELVEGKSLWQRVAAPHSLLSPQRCIAVCQQVAAALGAAHQCGVLHRDLKPDNVLLDADGGVRVIDFGISKVLGPSTSAQQLSRVVGTPIWMAPEQFEPGNTIDARLDLYQLGALAHFLLTGHPPYRPLDTENSTAAMMAIVSQQQKRKRSSGPAPSLLRPELKEIAPKLDALTATLLSTQPDRRPGTSTQVLQLLAAAAEDVRGEGVEGRVVVGVHRPAVPARGVRRALQPPARPADDARTDGPRFWPRVFAVAGGVVVIALLAFLATRPWNNEAPSAPEGPPPTVDLRSLAFDAPPFRAVRPDVRAATPLRDMTVTYRGKFAVVAPARGPVFLWDIAAHRSPGTIPVSGVQHLAAAPDRSAVAVVANGDVEVWSLDGGGLLERRPFQGALQAIALGPGARMAAADKNQLLVSDGEGDWRRYDGHKRDIVTVAVHPDGNWIATGSRDNTVRVVEASTGALAAEFTGHTDNVSVVAFSPDGQLLATGSWDHTVTLVQTDTWKATRLAAADKGAITALAWSKDSKQLLAGGRNGTLTLWSRDGSKTRTLSPSDHPVLGVGWSADGRMVIASDALLEIDTDAAGWQRTWLRGADWASIAHTGRFDCVADGCGLLEYELADGSNVATDTYAVGRLRGFAPN